MQTLLITSLKNSSFLSNKTQKDVDKIDNLVKAYDEKIAYSIVKEDQASNNYDKIDSKLLKDSGTHAPLWIELKELLVRTAKNLYRNPTSTRMRIIQTLVMGILVDLVFWDLGSSREDVRGKAGFCFFISVNQTMTAMFSVLLLFIIERPVFLREYANKTYGTWTYFVSKSIIEIPFQFIFPIVFSFMVYFAAGMTVEIGRFLVFNLILIAVVLCATSVGLFIGWVFDNPSKATAGSMMIMMPYIIFGGFFVNLNTVYVWLRWITYLSPIRYATEALLRNELEDNGDYSDEDQIYKAFDYNTGLTWWIIILFGLAIVFRVIAVVALKLTVSKVQ